MSTFEKLRIKIKDSLDLELFDFKRTRIGYSGREAGGFSWVARSEGVTSDFGSCYTVKELLKYDSFETYSNGYGIEIIPKEEK